MTIKERVHLWMFRHIWSRPVRFLEWLTQEEEAAESEVHQIHKRRDAYHYMRPRGKDQRHDRTTP